jgi:hypothetical protein
MTIVKKAKNWRDYLLAVMCGLTGSLASLCAKIGLQPTNAIYRYFDTMNYGSYIIWSFRVFFLLSIVYCNVKMLEYKIRSFASLGSSLTVVIAF